MNNVALIILLENNWSEFVEYCGSEVEAEQTLSELQANSGVDE